MFIGERLTILRGSAMSLILAGIVLVCKPSFLFHETVHGGEVGSQLFHAFWPEIIKRDKCEGKIIV